jgi:hypothetical protein
VLLVVSRLVSETARERADLVFPHESVRNHEGRVIGCRKLATIRNHRPTPARTDPPVGPCSAPPRPDGSIRGRPWPLPAGPVALSTRSGTARKLSARQPHTLLDHDPLGAGRRWCGMRCGTRRWGTAGGVRV